MHTIEMHVSGPARASWPLLFEPLHDALMEDAMDRASAFTGTPFRPARWGGRVRALRAALRMLRAGGPRERA
jgi:hypothetical protein